MPSTRNSLLSKIKFHEDLNGKIELIPHLPLENIVPTETLVRKIDGGTVNDLRESIQEKGLLQPILVRPIGRNKFEIIFGNHRYYACKGLEWKTIPAQVKRCDRNEALLLGLIENIQRRNMNPYEEGRFFKQLITPHSIYDVKWLSKEIGKSTQYIKKRLKIYEGLNEKLVSKIGDTLSILNAYRLSRLPEEKQLVVYEELDKYRKHLSTPKSRSGFGHSGSWTWTGKSCVCPRCGREHKLGVKGDKT